MRERKNFTDALTHCKCLGGALGLPESAEDNQRIFNELVKSKIFIRILYPFFATESRETTVLISQLTQLAFSHF